MPTRVEFFESYMGGIATFQSGHVLNVAPLALAGGPVEAERLRYVDADWLRQLHIRTRETHMVRRDGDTVVCVPLKRETSPRRLVPAWLLPQPSRIQSIQRSWSESLGSGPRGRRFESCQPDFVTPGDRRCHRGFSIDCVSTSVVLRFLTL